MSRALPRLLEDIRACTVCAPMLPVEPRPVLQAGEGARILVASQAPGRAVFETGVPFNDASGVRLREWLGVTREEFYDDRLFAVVPMGFCYPGKGLRGDLPPRKECAPKWRTQLLSRLPADRTRRRGRSLRDHVSHPHARFADRDGEVVARLGAEARSAAPSQPSKRELVSIQSLVRRRSDSGPSETRARSPRRRRAALRARGPRETRRP